MLGLNREFGLLASSAASTVTSGGATPRCNAADAAIAKRAETKREEEDRQLY
jgi:hypothetical protein